MLFIAAGLKVCGALVDSLKMSVSLWFLFNIPLLSVVLEGPWGHLNNPSSHSSPFQYGLGTLEGTHVRYLSLPHSNHLSLHALCSGN